MEGGRGIQGWRRNNAQALFLSLSRQRKLTKTKIPDRERRCAMRSACACVVASQREAMPSTLKTPKSARKPERKGVDEGETSHRLSKSESKKPRHSSKTESAADLKVLQPAGKAKKEALMNGHRKGQAEGHMNGVEPKSSKGKEKEEAKRDRIKIHLSRFVEYLPKAINAVAYNPIENILAVARSNGDIQLWRTTMPRWHPIGVCVGSGGSQIRSLCWANKDEKTMRLFSASLDGSIMEWSMNTLAPIVVNDSHGGSIWWVEEDEKEGRRREIGGRERKLVGEERRGMCGAEIR
eukprot:766420-Hanusia_phi.AAC.3